MTYTYSESAQLRVAKQGPAEIIAFIEELSVDSQNQILSTRAPVPGFRKNSPALLKKQRELLGAAIGYMSSDNFRPKPSDWATFGAIWSRWGLQKFSAAFPSGPFNFAEATPDESLNFVRDLVEKCNSGCAREDIARLVLFSGLPTTDSVETFIARLPLKESLEREQALAKLPEEVGALRHQTKEIERNLGKLANELQAKVEDVEKAVQSAQQSVDATTALQESLANLETKFSASSSKDSLAIADRFSTYSKQLDLLRADYEGAHQTLDFELCKQYQSLRKHVDALSKEVVEVRAGMEALIKNQQELGDSLNSKHFSGDAVTVGQTSTSNNDESGAHYAAVWMDLGLGKEPKDQEEIETIFQLTQGNVLASGIQQSDADRTTRTMVSAMIAGQLLQCCGSLADVLGTTAAISCGGGKVLSWQVPLGLRSTVAADEVQRIAERSAAGAVVLRGLNRSAFEIYGAGVRDVVVRRHVQRQESIEQLALIATYAEGPATLPINTSLVELGPLLDTDTLVWGESTSWQSIELGKSMLKLQHFRSPLEFRDEVDEIHLLVDALGVQPTKLWRMVFSRFVNVLFLLPGASFENSVSVALHAWVLPWAKVQGLKREHVEDAIRTHAIEQLNACHVKSVLDGLDSEIGA